MPAQSATITIRRLTQLDADLICAKHERLWASKPGGARAVFAWADLSGLDFSRRNLADAEFTGAILEGVRPDLVVISDAGQAVLADLADLLPLPMPPSPPLRASLYTAPELILSPQSADARADLYSFGAMLY